MKRTILPLLLLIIIAFTAEATEIYNKEGDYIAYIPEDWTVHNNENPMDISFVSEDQTMGMRIYCYPKEKFDSALDIFKAGTADFDGEAGTASFSYSGSDAIVADVSFIDGDSHFKGWFLAINGKNRDYFVVTFTPKNLYTTNLPTLLSAIDSISFGLENRYLPGAVSQLYYPYSGDSRNLKEISIPFTPKNKRVNILIDPKTEEASQVVIEREAMVVANLTQKGEELFYLGWIRYYRLIYRDNKVRLQELSEKLSPILEGKSDKEKASLLLAWVQSFRYVRTQDTLSDFLTPVTAVKNMEGDCDVRAMLYVILLNYQGIDALFLVSEKYKHALAAVDIPGEGIKYNFGDKGYIMTETTVKDLKPGFIDKEHSDPSKWVPIFFKGDSLGRD